MNEALLRTMIDGSLEGIGVSSLPDLRFIYVNEAFAKITGYLRTELEGHTTAEIDIGLNAGVTADIQSRLARDGCVRDLLLQFRSKKGELTTALGSAVISEDGGNPRLLWMLHDVTELKRTEASLRAEIAERTRTEQRLRESEAMVRKIIETSPDSVTITRFSDGTYREVNQAFLRHVGRERSEVVGKSLSELNVWADPAQARIFIRRLRTDGMIKNMEVSLRCKKRRRRAAHPLGRAYRNRI